MILKNLLFAIILSVTLYGDAIFNTPEDEPPTLVELIISYKAKSSDMAEFKERYWVSSPIVKKGAISDIEQIECQIDASKYDVDDDESYYITSIIKNEQDAMLECLFKEGVMLKNDAYVGNLMAKEDIYLSLSPTRILAFLDNKTINITILRDK